MDRKELEQIVHDCIAAETAGGQAKMDRKYYYPNGDLAKITDAQRVALKHISNKYNLGDRVTVYSEIMSEAVTVEAGGMILGVEPDGYIHS